MSGFEGSFLGEASRIDPDAVLECGVCWWVYDPTRGDETWQIPAGTPFIELPDYWRCPNCDAARAQFMVLRRQPGNPAPAHQRPPTAAGLATIRRLGADLLRVYSGIDARMRVLPVYNHALDIQVIGLRRWTEGMVGIVATPWCMNILLLPPHDTPARIEGSVRSVDFPSGRYRFIAGRLEGIGQIESCSLFSPMDTFNDPAVVAEVARHAIGELFERPADVRATPGMSRRGFLRGGKEYRSESAPG